MSLFRLLVKYFVT